MELDTVNICKVPGVQSQWISAREIPEAGGPVVGPANKVEAAGADVHVPHRVAVASVQHCIREAAQVPVADGGVLRAGQEARAVRQEAGTIDGATVTSQSFDLTATDILIIHLRTPNLLLLLAFVWMSFL